MPEGFSLHVHAEALMRDLHQIDKDVNKGTAAGLRKAAGELRKVSKAKTPVYKGARAAKRPKKGEAVPFNRPVSGLLRASIKSGRLRPQGTDGYAIVTGPTGARARLYAAKIERIYGYMEAGQEAAEAQSQELLSREWQRAMKGRG